MGKTIFESFKGESFGLGQIPGTRGGPVMSGDEAVKSILGYIGMLSSTAVLRKGQSARVVTFVADEPQRVIHAKEWKAYLMINQSSALASGTTATGTLVASAERTAAGNSQGTSLGVANFRSAHLFLDISAVVAAGTSQLNLYSQANDPASGLWADGINVFPYALHNDAVGTYYAYIGPNGLASDLAMRWEIAGGSGITFSVGYVLKEGLPGSQTGVARTIYLNNSNKVNTKGFPLLEGQSWALIVEPGVDLWGVTETALDLNVYELS
jgi:uncharacterized protein YfiM (DUF2279 family)